MIATPEECLSMYVLGQLRAINSILSITDKHVEYDEKDAKNRVNYKSFREEIKEMGEKLKANYFPQYTP